MKQNSIKILKTRLIILKKKINYNNNRLLKLLSQNKNNILEKKYFIKNFLLHQKYFNKKKICQLHGKNKSVNKKLKLSRTVINSFLINNTLSFFKKINKNSKCTIFFFKK